MLPRDSLCSGMEVGFNYHFHSLSKSWCSRLVISALGGCRQEDHYKFESWLFWAT